MTIPRICVHCQKPQQGFASVTVDGITAYLCHPDDGLDCYHLVTVWGHPVPCPNCPGVGWGVRTLDQALE